MLVSGHAGRAQELILQIVTTLINEGSPCDDKLSGSKLSDGGRAGSRGRFPWGRGITAGPDRSAPQCCMLGWQGQWTESSQSAYPHLSQLSYADPCRPLLPSPQPTSATSLELYHCNPPCAHWTLPGSTFSASAERGNTTPPECGEHA